jgi:hypothetical protein
MAKLPQQLWNVVHLATQTGVVLCGFNVSQHRFDAPRSSVLPWPCPQTPPGPFHLLATRESHYMRSWSLLKRTLLAYREQVVWVGVLQVRAGPSWDKRHGPVRSLFLCLIGIHRHGNTGVHTTSSMPLASCGMTPAHCLPLPPGVGPTQVGSSSAPNAARSTCIRQLEEPEQVTEACNQTPALASTYACVCQPCLVPALLFVGCMLVLPTPVAGVPYNSYSCTV